MAAPLPTVPRLLQPPAGSFFLFGSFHPEPLRIDGIRCEPLEPWLRQLRP